MKKTIATSISALALSATLASNAFADSHDSDVNIRNFTGTGVSTTASEDGVKKEYSTTLQITKLGENMYQKVSTYELPDETMEVSYKVIKKTNDLENSAFFDIVRGDEKIGWGYCFYKKKKMPAEMLELLAANEEGNKKGKLKKVCNQTISSQDGAIQETFIVKTNKTIRFGSMLKADGTPIFWKDKVYPVK